MTLQDDRLSEVSLTRSAFGYFHGYTAEFHANAMRVQAEDRHKKRMKYVRDSLREQEEKRKAEMQENLQLGFEMERQIENCHEWKRPTLSQIKHRVAWVCGISIEEIESIRRNKNIVNARHMYAYLSRKYTSHSFPQIGRTLGGRDHSTIIHAATAWPKRKTKLRAGK